METKMMQITFVSEIHRYYCYFLERKKELPIFILVTLLDNCAFLRPYLLGFAIDLSTISQPPQFSFLWCD